MSPLPRVLAVCHRWPAPGPIRFTLERLARDGVPLTLAAPVRNGAPPPVWADFVELPPPGASRLRLASRAARDALALLARDRAGLRAALRAGRRGDLRLLRSCLALARARPAVLHLYADEVADQFAELAREWPAPVVMSCRGALIQVSARIPVDAALRQRIETALRSSSAVHCVSRRTAEVVTRLGAESGRVRVIYSGLDPAFFRPPARRSKAPLLRIVSGGWYRWLKGYEYALVALRNLLDNGVPARLDVLGGDPPGVLAGGTDRPRIVHAVRDLGLEEHVRLHDRVSSEGFRDRLWESDVLIHASLTEGIPNVVLEAMACALPVVTTDCGGVREAVRDGVEGIVVDLRDGRALARALEQLWRNPALRHRMGRAGRERVLAQFELGRQARELISVYREVAA